jgi:glycosyltransferase involved in cell wall biosynthesis
MTGLPLIIDFRDGWTLDPDPLMRYPLKLNKFIDRFMEQKVMSSADHIIAVTKSIAEEYFELYPDLRSKITVIPNGFDYSEFPKHSKKSEKFTITYTGSLYGSGTRPYNHFFKAINHLISNGLIPPDKIQVFIVGSNEKRIINDIERYQLQNNVHAIERLSQYKALEYTNSADLLLVIELTNSVTTKIYEYLSTGKPILAIIAKGELEELINSYSDNSYTITSGNEDEIIRSILNAYNKWTLDALKNTNTDTLKLYCNMYNRKSLTGKLSIIFDKFNFHGRR